MNLLEERYQFYHRQQKVHESVEEFAYEIKRLAASCLFESAEQSIVRDRILFGLKNKKLLMRIVQFGGDPAINEVINLYSVLANENAEKEKPLRSKRWNWDVEREPNVSVKEGEWKASDDGHNGFDDLCDDFGESTVKEEPVIELADFGVQNKLEVMLTDIKDTLLQTHRYDLDLKSESAERPTDKCIDLDLENPAGARKIKTKARPKSKLRTTKDAAFASPKQREKTKPKPSSEIKKCPICSAEFKWQCKYDYHVQNHRNCPICGKDFRNKYYLDNHMWVHTTEKPVSCPKCQRGFKNDYHMKKHLERTHATFDNITCPICGKVCRREWLLKIHIEGQHPETIPNSVIRQYECYVCRKPLKSELTLRNHLYLHGRKKELLCPQCGESFFTESKLREHLMRDDHNAEGASVKPFACDYCGKRFRERTMMRMHRNVHTGEKPFECSTCGKRFGHTGNLRQHKLTHLDEKRHHCQFCDHKCRSAGNLRKHMKVHTGR